MGDRRKKVREHLYEEYFYIFFLLKARTGTNMFNLLWRPIVKQPWPLFVQWPNIVHRSSIDRRLIHLFFIWYTQFFILSSNTSASQRPLAG